MKDAWRFSRTSWIVPHCLCAEPTTDGGGLPDNTQAATVAESGVSAAPKSDSDTFLTTPDEDEEKIIIINTGQDEDGQAPRRPKKDLLEIDRFTICGNRIDWVLCKHSQSASWQSSDVQGSDTGPADGFLYRWPMEYLFIY